MDRYTRRDAERAFERLVYALADPPEGKHWTLDYAPGGYVVELVDNVTGGVSQPFGPMRRNARDFVQAVRFLTDAMHASGITRLV